MLMSVRAEIRDREPDLHEVSAFPEDRLTFFVCDDGMNLVIVANTHSVHPDYAGCQIEPVRTGLALISPESETVGWLLITSIFFYPQSAKPDPGP